MTIIHELRVPLPMTVEEFRVGQLYAVAEASKEATNGKTAIEILKNEPYKDPIMGEGQYTHKIYHIADRVPKIISAVAPVSALKIEERAWNAYPYCKTTYTNQFMGERFSLTVESMHLNDEGLTENALKCDTKALSRRKVHFMDIWSPDDPTTKDDPKLDTTKVASVKANRGPLTKDWQKTMKPLMCCYKLVTIKFHVFGLQGAIESNIDRIQKDILMKYFKQVYCLMDEWFDLTIEDIRELEEKTKNELDEKIEGLALETREKHDPKVLKDPQVGSVENQVEPQHAHSGPAI